MKNIIKNNIDNIDNKKKIIIVEWIMVISISIIMSIIFNTFIQIVNVNGDSMSNTLKNGEKLILYKKAYSEEAPKYGDIIVTKDTIRHKSLIKRVIGTEGDKLQIIENKVYINGEKLIEDYIKEEMVNNLPVEVVIPNGFIFVMGDNRNNSLDSRNKKVGLINYKQEVIGKILNR